MRIMTGGGNITKTGNESTRRVRREHLQNKHTKLDVRPPNEHLSEAETACRKL